MQFHDAMKTSIILFVVLCGGIACAIVFFERQKPAPVSAPIVVVSNQTAEQTPPEKIVAPNREPTQTIAANTNEPAQVVISTANEAKSNDPTNLISKVVDALLSAKSGDEKHKLFQQLVQSGQIDQAIAELQQRAAQNPSDPEIPTTIGEALLNKLRAIYEAGGGQNNDELGILAMQADMDFNAALKIDPQNWEAQFVKASSMYYWPSNPQVDNDVVQRLSSLIDQQETMPSQPQFAQTYIVLGNEYQKLGQPDKAAATWQLGLTKFPNDPTLQKKINNPSAQ
jgi:tetratricopeptide (TPR) repeat protein